MYAYNLAADQSHGSVFNLVREGNLSIEIKLKESSTESITIVCYLEYDSIIEIDSDRNIHTYEEHRDHALIKATPGHPFCFCGTIRV